MRAVERWNILGVYIHYRDSGQARMYVLHEPWLMRSHVRIGRAYQTPVMLTVPLLGLRLVDGTRESWGGRIQNLDKF